MKKLLSLAMAIVLLLSLAVPTVSAETLTTGSTGKDITVNYTPGSTSADPIIKSVSIEVKNGDTTVRPVDDVYTIKSTSSVTLTVTGENLNQAGDKLYVWYAAGVTTPVSDFTIAADGKSATKTIDGSRWRDSTYVFEILYSNDGNVNEKYQKGGIKVIYDDGTPRVTGITLKIGDTTYTSSNTSATNPAKITPQTTKVELTITGINLDKITEDHRIRLSPKVNHPLNDWNLTGTTTLEHSYIDDALTYFQSATQAYELCYTGEGNNASDSDYTGLGVYVQYENVIQGDAAKITGVSIEVTDSGETVQPVDGVYTIKSTSSVTLTVTGENLNQAGDKLNVWYTAVETMPVSNFTIAADGKSATKTIDGSRWTSSTNVFEILYSNDGDVDEKYQKGGIKVIYDDGTPWITGVAIEVTDGGEKIEAVGNVYTISPTSVVKITVRGRNLSKVSGRNYLQWIEGRNTAIESSWDTNESGTIATNTSSGREFVGTSTSEILFYNGSEKNLTGIYVTYDENAAKVKITDMTLTVDGKEYKSGDIATITPKTQSVTITFTGEKLDKAPQIAHMKFTSSFVEFFQDANFNDDETTATFTIETYRFESYTTALQLQYTLDGENFVESSIYVQYQQNTISVDIEWGALSFTYSDERDESGKEKGWTCTEDADKIEVTNAGTNRINVQLTYTAAEAYVNVINGGFGDKSSATIEPNDSETFTLKLSGKPKAALNGETIGTVTVSITTATDTGTEE